MRMSTYIHMLKRPILKSDYFFTRISVHTCKNRVKMQNVVLERFCIFGLHGFSGTPASGTQRVKKARIKNQ